MTNSIDNLINDFSRTTDEIFSLEELKNLLNSGKKLRIKYGVDVTAPHLHIGHAVNLWMLRKLQDLGHKVIFLVGDFTTRIGDPSGKNKTRPVIPLSEIEENTKLFIDQAKMVLRFDDPELLEIRRNSEWFDNMKTSEFLGLLSMVTHSRLIARDMFQKRIAANDEIHMHELIYPILQAYDSFVLDSDLTIIGSDQLFNEMLGRTYQERLGGKPQVIITTKITPGIDGKEKQSKSLGNYIGLSHSPKDKFGRVMRIPDNLIIQYFEVYTDIPMEEIEKFKDLLSSNPMDLKKRLAFEVVKRYHGEKIALEEQTWFEETFSKNKTPEDIEELLINKSSASAIDIVKEFFKGSKSNSEIKKLFTQGAVSVDDEKIADFNTEISLDKDCIFKVGKRTWFKAVCTK